jgi:hypothetical protein
MHRNAITIGCVAVFAGCDLKIQPEVLFACEPREPIGTLRVEITVAPGSSGPFRTVFVGDTIPLIAHVRPVVGGTNDLMGSCNPVYGDRIPVDIDWYSFDPRLATVSAAGIVTGVAPGRVTITASVPLRDAGASHRIEVLARGDARLQRP